MINTKLMSLALTVKAIRVEFGAQSDQYLMAIGLIDEEVRDWRSKTPELFWDEKSTEYIGMSYQWAKNRSRKSYPKSHVMFSHVS